MPHEGNSENTFSLSGTLSNENTHTQPDHLSRMVRINKNKGVCKPTHQVLRKKYHGRYATSYELDDGASESDLEDSSDDVDSEEEH